MYKLDLLDIALLISSGFALWVFISLVSFAKRKLSNLFLGFFSGAIFFVLFKGVIHANEYYQVYPSLLFLPIYWTTGIGCFLYFFIQCTIDKSYCLKLSIIIHFLPLIIQVFYHGYWYFQTPGEKLEFYTNQYFFDLLLYEEISAILISSTYTILAYLDISNYLKKSKLLLSPASLQSISWSKKLNQFFLAFIFLWTGYTLVDLLGYGYKLPYVAYYPLYILLVLYIVWIAVGLFNNTQLTNTHAQLRQILDDRQIDRLKTKIDDLLFPEIFDPDKQPPIIEVLACQLNVTKKNLSDFFKIYFETTYPGFIRKARMEKFHELVQIIAIEEQEYSIRDLRERCGYANKASFNRHVMEFFGQSPSEYLDYIRSQNKSNP